jgi:hypothetical protein
MPVPSGRNAGRRTPNHAIVAIPATTNSKNPERRIGKNQARLRAIPPTKQPRRADFYGAQTLRARFQTVNFERTPTLSEGLNRAVTHEHASALSKSLSPLWMQVKLLFTQHHFITIVCAFFVVVMVVSFYRFLRSISPALVGLVLCLVVFILILHWTQTRTEPRLFKPFIDWLAPWFPAPVYPNK